VILAVLVVLVGREGCGIVGVGVVGWVGEAVSLVWFAVLRVSEVVRMQSESMLDSSRYSDVQCAYKCFDLPILNFVIKWYSTLMGATLVVTYGPAKFVNTRLARS
jgi:hypothetical protein